MSVSGFGVYPSWKRTRRRFLTEVATIVALLFLLRQLYVFKQSRFGTKRDRLVGIRQLRQTCGVITTIFDVNDAVEAFVTNTDASLVVVGDKKTSKQEWEAFQEKHYDKVTYLSPALQVSLPFSSIRYIPWNHFGRKSIGYLYAVAGGCDMIYDFDDDNHLKLATFKELSNWTHVELRTKEHALHVFNPYPYFQPTNNSFIWPRGFPLQFIRDPRAYDAFSGRFWEVMPMKDAGFHRVAVIQSLADHDPDVDAIYRLTRPLPVNFRRKNTILIAPRGTYSPWNAQAVLVSRSAFFGLLLPVTVTGRVSDIWRSYITSRLLWETDFKIAFASSFVTQYRNPHSYMVDYVDENDLYNRVDHLLQTLAHWTSDGCKDLASAYVSLLAKLVAIKVLRPTDLALAKAWINDLRSIGYNWPSLRERMSAVSLVSAKIIDERNFHVQ